MNPKLSKFVNFIKQYPVIIASAILIPSLVVGIRYTFSVEHVFHNYYYDGERIDVEPKSFKLKSIDKIGDVVQVASAFSYQGGACYQNYYAICCDNFEAIIIYDSTNMKVAHTINTGQYNTKWHCNQMFFGPDFFSTRDKFPLLYISMEHKDERSIKVFRLFQRSGDYQVQLIQTITLEFEKPEDTIYYPNAYFDYESNYLYWAGYTEDSYLKSDTNKLRFYQFYFPDFREDECVINTMDKSGSFELPSETATQGGFISGNHLYQTFSFASKTDPVRAPKMRVVDLENANIVVDYQNLGETFGVYEEFEHVAISNSGRLLALGNPFHLYEFKYEG